MTNSSRNKLSNDAIGIYFIDEYYGNWDGFPDKSESEISDLFLESIKSKLSKRFEEEFNLPLPNLQVGNIGAGSDWPTWVLFLAQNPIVAVPFILFFQGKKINENLDAWKEIGQKIRNLFEGLKFRLNRNAAGVLVVSEILSQSNPKSLQLESYISHYDIDNSQSEFDNGNPNRLITNQIPVINCTPSEEYLDKTFHEFILIADSKRLKVVVNPVSEIKVYEL